MLATTEINTKVVGTTFALPRDDSRWGLLNAGDPLEFRRNPQNQYDPNAIEVHHGAAGMIGHVRAKANPDESVGLAAKLAPLMDKGAKVTGEILDVTGGVGDKNRGINIVILVSQKTDYHDIEDDEMSMMAQGYDRYGKLDND